jgi:hypothetical protein
MSRPKFCWHMKAFLFYVATSTLLAVSLPGVVNGGTIVNIDGSSAVFGLPGTVVGWGFSVTSDPGVYPLFTGSQFTPDPNPVGTYVDYLASGFFYGFGGAKVVDSFNQSSQGGAGEFDVSPSALLGASVLGSLQLFWDAYSVSPANPSFDPVADLLSTGNSASLNVSIAIGLAPVPVATPEPGTFWLSLLGICPLAWRVIRRMRVRVGAPSLVIIAALALAPRIQAFQLPVITDDETRALNLLRYPYGPVGTSGTSGIDCHTDHDPNRTNGCCGSPGAFGCTASGLPNADNPKSAYYCTFPETNVLRNDSYDSQTYCNLPETSCDHGVENSITGTDRDGPQDLTFYFTSDIHFYRPPGFPLEGQLNHIYYMNNLWSLNFPWTFALDPIGKPVGVVIGGDIGLDATAPNLGAYRLMYEQGRTTSSINFPVFFGLGNHEIVTEAEAGGAHRMWDYIRHRMGTCSDASQISMHHNTGNYSWDWGRLHLIMLNTWADETNSLYNQNTAGDGLAWLANDLATRVGKSGRPVIIFQHYEFASFFSQDATHPSDTSCSNDPKCRGGGGWTLRNATDFLNTIGGYNIAGIFAGHTHAPSVEAIEATGWSCGIFYYTSTLLDNNGKPVLDNNGKPKTMTERRCDPSLQSNQFQNTLGVPLDVFVNGTGSVNNSGDFFAVRFTEGAAQGSGSAPATPPYLDVEALHWDYNNSLNNNNGSFEIKKGLSVTNNPGPNHSDNAVIVDFYGGKGACRKAIDTSFRVITPLVSQNQTFATNALLVTFSNPNGIALPSQLAIRVQVPGDPANSLNLKSFDFADRCGNSQATFWYQPPTAPNAAFQSSEYVLINPSQFGYPIALQFTGDPSTHPPKVDLVALTPLGGATAAPSSIDVPISFPAPTMAIMKSFTVYGPRDGKFSLGSMADTGGGQIQTWWGQTMTHPCGVDPPGPCFGPDGVATVTFKIDEQNFIASNLGQDGFTFFISGVDPHSPNATPYRISVHVTAHLQLISTPSAITVNLAPPAPAFLTESFTLSGGPRGAPFSIVPTFTALFTHGPSGAVTQIPQAWAIQVMTWPCPLCFDSGGSVTVTFKIDTAQLLALNTNQAVLTFLVNSLPGQSAPFSLSVGVTVNMPPVVHIQVVTASPPARLFTATLIPPNSFGTVLIPFPTGQMTLSDVTLDSSGNITSTTPVTFGSVNNTSLGLTCSQYPFDTVIFGLVTFPCFTVDAKTGAIWIPGRLPLGLHHFIVQYAGDLSFPPGSSPVFNYLVGPPPSLITAQSGSGQSTLPGTSFAQPLKALVTSADLTPLPGFTVTFTAPSTGASATFPGGSTAVLTTDANGVATSPPLTPNQSLGSYQVTASVAGVSTPAAFSLTNTGVVGTPLLTATVASKTGNLNARVWTVKITNTQSAATGSAISSIAFTQVGGTTCTPVIQTPLPIALGDIANGASALAPVTIDFSSCASTARFTVKVGVQANGGAYQRTTTIGNQFP